MISEKENKRLSKFLSLILRHQPETIGITLDENGWTDIDILIKKMVENNTHIDKSTLEYIVESNTKKRFAFNEDYSKIRANQGHSIDVELGYIAQQPPTILYHGTAEKNMDAIKLSGINKLQRHHVHLTENKDTAYSVGERYGKPYVIEVLSEQMHADGHKFFLSDNGVWLTDNVPTNYLKEFD